MAVVPKEENNPFFAASRDGCVAAAKEIGNVQCVFRGPISVDVRQQDKIISDLINEGVDGIAIAVSQSDFLASNSVQKALRQGIPVITYDADFSQESLNKYPNLRAAYIGTNDFELGRALGELLKVYRPNGGNIVIQTGRPDSPNLNLRVMGVRSALSGINYDTPPGERLSGERGWREFSEKPLYNFGQNDRAERDLKNVLSTYKRKGIDAFVAVGGWTQFVDSYTEVVGPHKQALLNQDIILIIADTDDRQLDYLRDNLAHGNVGQKPYEMGRQAILTLHNLIIGESVDEVVHVPMTICTPKNYAACTK
ncbi:substrate-binding domain-containing protein [Vibrio sp. S4M6]|uniref:substrate-binding domain-containing protein n=1 Tax=Vibrio sinus TaxID=2946865 RepID=UPI002029F082|nr:substrate-binding domain-containing protein [Vibrio sinus]MCL9780629.1 substrate-binding domain-containing protein [Vibrio sinus]